MYYSSGQQSEKRSFVGVSAKCKTTKLRMQNYVSNRTEKKDSVIQSIIFRASVLLPVPAWPSLPPERIPRCPPTSSRRPGPFRDRFGLASLFLAVRRNGRLSSLLDLDHFLILRLQRHRDYQEAVVFRGLYLVHLSATG
ncbi:hypothetical protein DBV15_01291 [Temnothorax longispinosus]|uniref:Uncharacterized protein n=1 Tax=Temnothorax longispinosus TaxID=300112 RepID=A0A4S2KJA3_9HYME|nr:hypothetical protein DBV15_01291 [Temnothorax longispinosus]